MLSVMSAVLRFVGWYGSLHFLGPLTPAIIAGFVILVCYVLVRVAG